MMVRAVTRVGHLALVISIVLTSWALSAALHIFYRVALWPLSACGLLDALWHHSARLRAVFALQLGEPGDGAPPSARALAEEAGGAAGRGPKAHGDAAQCAQSRSAGGQGRPG